MKRLWMTLVAIVRELSDESAYRRYLAAHGSRPSAESWRRFSDERLRRKYSRAKCC